MTLRTNSRVAGYAFLLYIAAALTGMVLSGRASSGEGNAARLASIASHLSRHADGHPARARRVFLRPRAGRDALRHHARRGPGPRAARHGLPRRRGRHRRGGAAEEPREALARDGRRERTRRTPRRRPRSAPTCSSCRAGARPCPRPSSPSAACSSPGCSCAAGSFPHGSRGSAWSHRSWSSSVFRWSSSVWWDVRSRTSCGSRCSPSSCCSRSGSSSGGPRLPKERRRKGRYFAFATSFWNRGFLRRGSKFSAARTRGESRRWSPISRRSSGFSPGSGRSSRG